MEPLSIDGAWVLTPRIHRDGRGSFLEWFRRDELAGCLGYRPDVAQANCSVSRRGVIRGVHIDPVLSEKDAAAPGLEEALALRLLPGYRECVGYAARMGGC